MHVAHRAGDLLGRPLEDVAAARSIQVSGAAGMDLVVAALIDQRRQVADLELEAGDDQDVGAGELQDEGRLGVHEMRILISLRQRERLHPVAADRVRDRGEVLEGRDDVELRLRGGREEKCDE